MQDIFLTAPARTPIGNMNGVFATMSATALASRVIQHVVQRAALDPQSIDEVMMGNVFSSGLGQAPARQAALGAGLSHDIDAVTVNHVCGSGLRAILMGADAVRAGSAKVVIAGGMESMSNVPYLMRQARRGYRYGHGEVTDAMLHDGLHDAYSGLSMAALADRCAAKYGVERGEQDEWAIESYHKAMVGRDLGWFDDEVVEIVVASGGQPTRATHDERIQKFDQGKLRTLPPLFGPSGTVTAGNACGLNDGAAALVVLSGEMRPERQETPVAKLLGYCHRGVPAELYATGPIEAIGALLRSLRLTPGDIDLYEINEPFAVVPLITIKALGIDAARVNVMGGAIALGHPIGATGARIVSTLLYALRRLGKRRGIAGLCIGGGGGIAVAVELIR